MQYTEQDVEALVHRAREVADHLLDGKCSRPQSAVNTCEALRVMAMVLKRFTPTPKCVHCDVEVYTGLSGRWYHKGSQASVCAMQTVATPPEGTPPS